MKADITTTRQSLIGGIAFVAVAATAADIACTEPNPNLETGFWWCTSADLACGQNDVGEFECVTRPDGAPVRGCMLLCKADSEILTAGEGGMLVPGSADHDRWQALRSDLADEAQSACSDRATELGVVEFDPSSDPDHVTCAEALADEDPFFSETDLISMSQCGGGGGDGTGGGGEGTDGGESSTGEEAGPGLFGLDKWSEVIDCPRATRCEVDVDFVATVLEDVQVLWRDDVLLRPDRLGLGYEFAEVGSTSLAAALGFQVGDTITAVEGFPTTNLAEYYAARGELTNWSTPATVLFVRGGKSSKLTVAPVDMHSYP